MHASGEGADGHIRIGELARRVGVSVELLRAWERRYGLLSPARTTGGLRLYTEEDERRVLRTLGHIADGVSAAEAARLTLRERADNVAPLPLSAAPAPGHGPAEPPSIGDQLGRALDRLDEPAAHAALDRLLSGFALETVLRDAVLRHLHALGDRWEQEGDEVIAQEHFASALLHGRLLGLARGWGGGYGPMALLGCLPGDRHDLGLICFGLALRAHGWRITFLGPDTPSATILESATALRPSLVVLTAMIRPDLGSAAAALTAIASHTPLALAGGGVDAGDAASVGARFLAGDPYSAAARVAAEAAAHGEPAEVRRPHRADPSDHAPLRGS